MSKHHWILAIINSLSLLFIYSCSGIDETKVIPSATLTSSFTTTPITPSSTITPSNTPSPFPTSTVIPTSTPDLCSPSTWENDVIFVLSSDFFGSLEPGGPNTFNRILISKNPAWEDFRQEYNNEMWTGGLIFHEISLGHQWGTGVNPAVVLITYGVERDWKLPAYGALVAKVDQIRSLLHRYEGEWFLNEVDRSQYPPIKNGASYALYRYFEGDQDILEKWCKTFYEVYGVSPLGH